MRARPRSRLFRRDNDLVSQPTRSVDLDGYDAPFRLKCWPLAVGEASHDASGVDAAALRARAIDLVGAGACGRIELLGWNFELNDWVRMELFGAR